MRIDRTLKVLLVIVGFALAAPAAAEDLNAAREHYRKGSTYFDLQKYIDAAHEYELAYEAKEDPALLFNIAQAYRLGGESAKALGAYKSFLRKVPTARNREEVATRINELQHIVDQQKHSAEAPPMGTLPADIKNEPSRGETPPTTPPAGTTTTTPTPEATATPPSQPTTPPPAVVAPVDRNAGRTKTVVGIALGAVGVAAIVVGIVMEVAASSASDDLTNAKSGTVFSPSKEETVKTDNAVGVAMLVVGGVSAAAGATLFILGRRESKRARSLAVAPVLSPTTAGLSFSGRF